MLINGVDQLTTQLYFDQASNDFVMGQEPCDVRGPQQTRNEDDVLLGSAARASFLFDLGTVEEGFIASYLLGVTRAI